jgi:GTP-binding protein HflX
VLEADMLFATLDPTLRAITLPHGAKVILSDTVGFISDLPTMLVAAFRATLEEVIEADVILHVRDATHEDTAAQAHDVEEVLRALDIDPDDHERLIEVWNKLDTLNAEARLQLENIAERRSEDRPVLTSALTGEGLDRLLGAIEERLARKRVVLDLVLDPADGAGVSWLHRNSEVMAKEMRDDGQLGMTVRADSTNAERIRGKFLTSAA